MMKQGIKFAPITDISFLQQPQKDKTICLEVNGYLPDSASQLKTENVQLREDERTIIIKILMKRDPTVMAMQVIKNFTKEISIVFPSDGKWTIKCNDKTLELTVTNN